jgi:DNA-binding MarR family transcriptional regulator
MSQIPQDSSKSRTDAAPPVHPSGSSVNPVALRTWLRLLSCHNHIETRLRHRLRQGFDTTLPRFDLMAQLERHPQGLKMRELSRLLMVTGGNVTGLVDRLAQEGLIERRDDPRDRRAYYVTLTAQGRAQFQVMAREHEQWVTELFQGLEEQEMTQLWALLGQLKSQLSAGGARGPGAN